MNQLQQMVKTARQEATEKSAQVTLLNSQIAELQTKHANELQERERMTRLQLEAKLSMQTNISKKQSARVEVLQTRLKEMEEELKKLKTESDQSREEKSKSTTSISSPLLSTTTSPSPIVTPASKEKQLVVKPTEEVISAITWTPTTSKRSRDDEDSSTIIPSLSQSETIQDNQDHPTKRIRYQASPVSGKIEDSEIHTQQHQQDLPHEKSIISESVIPATQEDEKQVEESRDEGNIQDTVAVVVDQPSEENVVVEADERVESKDFLPISILQKKIFYLFIAFHFSYWELLFFLYFFFFFFK